MMNAVVECARTYRRVPYVHQGRTRHGIDCAGLVICVARDLGLVAPSFDIGGYERTPDGVSLLAHCSKWMKRIPALELGTVAVLHFKGSVAPQHMGIVGDYRHGGFTLIHANGTVDGKGRVIEERVDDQMLRRLVAVFRLET